MSIGPPRIPDAYPLSWKAMCDIAGRDLWNELMSRLCEFVNPVREKYGLELALGSDLIEESMNELENYLAKEEMRAQKDREEANQEEVGAP